jgi:hypothetical protein
VRLEVETSTSSTDFVDALEELIQLAISNELGLCGSQVSRRRILVDGQEQYGINGIEAQLTGTSEDGKCNCGSTLDP